MMFNIHEYIKLIWYNNVLLNCIIYTIYTCIFISNNLRRISILTRQYYKCSENYFKISQYSHNKFACENIMVVV